MSVTQWNKSNSPWGDPFGRMERRMSQLMRHFFNDRDMYDKDERSAEMVATPPIDVVEEDKAWVVYAELPGAQKNDIKVDVRHDNLVISAGSCVSKDATQDNIRYQERHTGRFERTLSLPEGVDRDKIHATFDNGILAVSMPKGLDAKPTRSISVS